MTEQDWKKINWFNKDERWGNWERMDPRLIYLLDKLREYINHKIIINYGTQGDHKPYSIHYRGKAVDCYCKGIPLLDFYLVAERFDFTGIGIYPFWNNPGLHLDIRTILLGQPQARWGKVGDTYVPLTAEFIKKYVIAQNPAI